MIHSTLTTNLTSISDSKSIWTPAYIALGSNVEHSGIKPVDHIKTAIKQIDQLSDCHVVQASSLYSSAPYGPVEQDDFVNTAISVVTQLSPETLMQALLDIEKTMGRIREQRWGPRIIDCDLLVYVGIEQTTEFLTLPHPEIAKRNFVLQPLLELAPSLMIPGQGRVSHLASVCEGDRLEVIDVV